MKIKLLLALRIALIVCIICTLSFTFYQSVLTQEASAEQSEAVGGFLGEIFPPDTQTGEFVQENVREIAHFTEFFFLGLFLSLYVVIFLPSVGAAVRARVRYMIYSLIICPIVPLIDETIQIFSGRGPEIADVWLDIFGYLTSTLSIYLSYLLIGIISRRYNDTKDE